MRLALTILFLLATTSTSFATKARQKALGNAFHLSGTQTVFTSPYHLMSVDNFIALESGLTGATNTDNGVEGSVLMNVNSDAKIFFSVGHLDEAAQSQRKFINNLAGVTAYKTQQNPVEVIYAWKNDSTVWGLGIYYSNLNNKTSGEKESSAGLRWAASYGDLKWKINLGLINSAVNLTGDRLSNDLYFNYGLRYNMQTLRYAFDFTTWNVSQTLNAALEPNESHHFQSMSFRLIDANKFEGGEFFYGIGLDQTNIKNKIADKKMNRLTAPMIMGAEVKATDWLIVRGSITQTVLIAQSKDEFGYPAAAVTGATGVANGEFAAEANNTVAAAGLGLALDKIQIDATLKGLIGATASQSISGADLLAQVGVVYKY